MTSSPSLRRGHAPAFVVLFNESINSTNHGDQVILESFLKETAGILEGHFVCHFAPFPALEELIEIARRATVCLHVGTNCMVSRLETTTPKPEATLRLSNNLLLCGVGWGNYERRPPTSFTLQFYNRVLRNGWFHSVRDSYTAAKLAAYGVRVLNTGCPSIWCLTPAHCAEIPREPSEAAVVTLTKFRRDPVQDRVLLRVVSTYYRRIYFWRAQWEDGEYLRELGGLSCIELPPSLAGLDELLRSSKVDYVGTRLHAGIRALQWRRRAIIVGVDNRAVEMAKDFGLPVVPRAELCARLEALVREAWPTMVQLDQDAINIWKRQLRAILNERTSSPALDSREPCKPYGGCIEGV